MAQSPADTRAESAPPRKLTVSSGRRPVRLDLYLREEGLQFSRTRVQYLIRVGLITVNDQDAKPSQLVRPGDRVLIVIPPTPPLAPAPEPIPLAVLFEDETVLVVDKPAGLVVHPAPGHEAGTLVNALLWHFRERPSHPGDLDRAGLVHRLDKDTSGVLVVGKTDVAYRRLARQFKVHTVRRSYLALVVGTPSKRQGLIRLPIGRDLWDRKRFSARTIRPKEAITEYRVLKALHEASLLELRPQTGRTHQIRVHLASLGHPVAGDRTYGGRRAALGGLWPPRQMLHAASLGFTHPATGEALDFTAPLPADFQTLLDHLERGTVDQPGDIP